MPNALLIIGIWLSFEDQTTLLPGGGGGGEVRISQLRSLEKVPPKYAIFSTVLSKIVAILMHAHKNKTKQNKTSTVGLKQTCDLHSNTGIRHKYLLVEALHSLLENVLSSLSWHQSSIYPLSYEHP